MSLNVGLIPRPSYSPVFDHLTGDGKPGTLHHVMSIGRHSGEFALQVYAGQKSFTKVNFKW